MKIPNRIPVIDIHLFSFPVIINIETFCKELEGGWEMPDLHLFENGIKISCLLGDLHQNQF